MLLRRIFRSVKKRMKKVVKKPKEAAVSTTTTTCTSSTTTTTSSSSVTTHKASSHPKRTSVAPLPSSSSPSSSNNNVFRSHSDLLLLKKSNGSAFHPPSSAKTRPAGAFPTTPSNTNARPLPPLSSAKPNKYAASSSTSSFYQSPSSAFSSVLAPPPTDTKPYHKINHNHSYSTATTATTTASSTTSNTIHHTSKPRKQVCFGYIMEHRYVKPPTRTKAQRKALWYSSKEIKAMRVEICVQRKKQKKHLVNKEEKAKHERRRDFVRSFLYFCNDLGVSDPRALAVFAATNSLNDRQRALVLARSDAHDACRIYHDFIMSPDGAEAAAARFFFGKPSSQRSLVSPSNLHQSKQGVSIAPPRRERLPPKSLEPRHLQTRPSVVTAHKVLTFQCAFL